MNKLFKKIATLSVGLAMAIGVGVAIGSNYRGMLPVHAANGSVTLNTTFFGLSGTGYQTKNVTDSTSGVTFNISNCNVNNGLNMKASSGAIWNSTGFSNKKITSIALSGIRFSSSSSAGFYVYGGTSSKSTTTTLLNNTGSTTNTTVDFSSYSYNYFYIKNKNSRTAAFSSIVISYADVTTNVTVTFNANGHGTAPASQTFASGGKATEPTAPTATGYTFGGWYENSGCTGSAWNFNTTISANKTLWAKWTGNKYNINYYDQGGSAFSGNHESGYPTQHTYGEDTTLKSASKTGYLFVGWFANTACTGDVVTTLGATAYTAAINLYAKWDQITNVTLAEGTFSKTYSVDGVWDWEHLAVTYTTQSGGGGTATGLTISDFSFSPSAPDDTSITSVSVTATYQGVTSSSITISGITVTEKQYIGGIVDGGKYIIVFDDNYYFPSANYSSNPGPLYTYSDPIHNVESNAWTFHAEGNTDDVWNIQSSSGQYIYCTNTAQGVRTGTLDTTSNTYDFTVSEAEGTYLGKQKLLLTVGSSGGYRTLTHYTNNSGNDVRAYTTEQNGTWEVVLIPYEAPDQLDEELTLSGYTTSFTVGDTFAFGGTATAHYTHGDESVTNDVTFELAGQSISVGDSITGDMVGNDVEVAVWYEDAKGNLAGGSYAVDIEYEKVSSVSITTSTSDIGKTGSFTFGATVLPNNANPNVKWSVVKKSGDITSGFSIDEDSGVLTLSSANAGGVLTVTATTVGKDSSSASKSASVDVTVTGDPVVTVSSSLTGYTGKNSSLSYSYSNFTGTLSIISGDTTKVTVGTPTATSSPSGSGIVQVNFLASTGEGTVTLSFKNGNDVVTTCAVTVITSAVESVSWSAENMAVYSGSTVLDASKVSSWSPTYTMNNQDTGPIVTDYTIKLNGNNYTLGTPLSAGEYVVSLTYENTTTTVNPTIMVVQTLRPISGNPQENVYSHTSSTKWTSHSEDQVLSGVTWTPDITWKTTEPQSGVQGVDGTKGQQIGTKNNSATIVKLSTSEIVGTVNTIVLETSGASDVIASVGIKVGATSFKCGGATSVDITQTNTSYTFTGSASGTIEIKWENSSEKALYFKSVTITSVIKDSYENQVGHEAAQAAVVKFAKAFNAAMDTTSGCTTNMSSAWSTASSAWTTFLSEAAALGSTEEAYAKSLIANASAQWTEDTDSNYEYCLERALATYEKCVNVHGQTAFMSTVRPVEKYSHFSPLMLSSANMNTAAIVIIVSVVSAAAVGGYFFLRKKKED